MDLFLLHSIGLLWASLGAARHLAHGAVDRLLAAALLAWGNIVATALLLSSAHLLGRPEWFLGSSAVLAGLVCLLAAWCRPEPAPLPAPAATGRSRINPWLLAIFILTLLPLAGANLGIAWAYQPNSEDSLTYQLPRALYYLGQNSLGHFDATDLRQTHLPFNYTLLQVFGLVYAPPLQCLNFFNLAAWAVSGLAVYRLCRLCALGGNVSLVACWLTLTSAPMLAQATTTTSALPAAAALICGAVFALDWFQTRRTRPALLTGLAAGLAAGSQLDILLFSLAIALPWGISAYRRKPAGELAGSLRPGFIAVLLAGVTAGPFLLINLAEPGPGLRRTFDFALQRAAADAAQKSWPDLLPLWQRATPLAVLNEDTAGFSFTGALFLLAGIYCLLRLRRPTGPGQVFAWLGLGWMLARLLCAGLSFPSPEAFLSSLLLLAPCAAAVMAAGWDSRAPLRYALGLIVTLAALSDGWSARVYLFKNTSRPLAPLLNTALPPPAPPALPLLVEYHLAGPPRINVDTDGVDESIFPFMALGHAQRFTAHRRTDPEAYNLLSRAGASRNAGYLNPTGASYVLVAMSSKSTAGVEFLVSRGPGATSRDYFGLEHAGGRINSVSTNRSLLVTLYPRPGQDGREMSAHILVAGLNPEDGTRLEVVPEYEPGARNETPLAVFRADGETVVSFPKPFHRLFFTALDESSGANRGTAAIFYRTEDAPPPPPQIDPNRPTGAGSIFVTDVVLAEKDKSFPVEGLLPVEGPFPQWDLPFLRWARQPAVRITIPPLGQFARLQVSFSVRLHVRKKAALEVLFNGRPVQHYRIDDSTIWLDQTLELTPQPGENVLEFRDAPLNHEPDWLGYLERYPDVMKHVTTNHLPLEQGAREHYETHGRAEGRLLQTIEKPEPAPDGYYFMFRHIRLEGFKKT